MSALAYRLPHQPTRRHLELVPSLPETRRPSAAVLRRRRIVALVAATTLIIGAWSVATNGVSWAWHQVTGPAPAATAAVPALEAPAKTWTVAEGDTLWSIARKVQPSGDIRPLVQQLSKAQAGKPLQIGQTIVLP